MDLRLCSALKLLVLLLFVANGSGNQHTIDWTPAGVASVSNQLEVDIGDIVVLRCPPNSYSNLIALVDEEQFMSCNSSVVDTNVEFRGSCLGFPISTNLIVNVAQPSARLPSDLAFTEGKTSYLTSFSRGTDLSSALNDKEAGGECSEGLRLALHIRDSTATEATTTTTTTTLPIESTSIKMESLPTTAKQDFEKLPISDISPEGLQAFSGNIGLQAFVSRISLIISVLFVFVLH